MLHHDAAIDVRDLSLRYDGVTALKGISLSIPAGAFVGLIGRNGAGKSSLLRCLVGLTVAQEGEVRLLGDDPGLLGDDTRKRIGYVGQLPDLLEWLSVGEHLEYIGGFYSNWSGERARDLCIRFDLAEGVRVRTLSPGQRQRLALILALAHDPELILLDEPVASLDPLARRDFMLALFEGRREKTAVISSHLLGDLERVVSHVVFMRAGEVQLSGAWDELADRMRLVVASTGIPPQPGLVSVKLRAGEWRHLIDLRDFDATAIPIGAGAKPLNLEDLFAELQA